MINIVDPLDGGLVISQRELVHMSHLELSAAVFAAKAHQGQVRKYCGSPYIVHPQDVVNILRRHGYNDDHMFAAAWLHDVVEDTEISQPVLETYFPDPTCVLVYWLTNPSTPQHGNRRQRKEIDRNHLQAASAKAQNVKCADVISNAPSIRTNDPDFWKVWSREKRELLTCTTRADQAILDEAWSAVR
jgi:(p)ppGpp synthase/HD superfamily hydrolase